MYFVRTLRGKSFPLTEGETLLDGAYRAGIVLPYSCRTGRCSTCRGRLISGSTTAIQGELGLTQTEMAAGWILTCVRNAHSDVEIDVDDLGDVRLPPPRTYPCRIESIMFLAEDVLRVRLRLPKISRFEFVPGQAIEIIGEAGLRRSYSLAIAPTPEAVLELHIRKVPGGAMSRYWFHDAKVADLLRLHGPTGTFYLRDVADRDIFLLATGTGIAPIKSMLEFIAHSTENPSSITVYWGGRTENDLYWNVLESGAQLKYVPVLSRADDLWQGARGYVQEAMIDAAPDWNRATVYACGSEAMIHAANTRLVHAGLPSGQFFSDAFVSSGRSIAG